MSVGICIIAHEPLASALKTSVAHIYSATDDVRPEQIVCFDVPSDVDVNEAVSFSRSLIDKLCETASGVVVFTDIIGATPSNIAHQLLDDERVRLVTGVNLAAIITALNAPTEASATQVMTMAEGAARIAISSSIGRE